MGRFYRSYLIFLFILLFHCILFVSLSLAEDSVIVEKNLFSPDREKWTMDPYVPGGKGSLKGEKGKVDDIILSGTVVSDNVKSAVLSESSKRKKEKASVYLEGDYMSGYLLKKINEKSVVLEDASSGEEYVIFLNDGKKSRTAVKTEIKDDPVQKPVDKDLNKKSFDEIRKEMEGDPAEESRRLKETLEKSLDRLQKDKSRIAQKQAEKNFRNLKKLYPRMTDAEKNEVRDLGKKLESLKKKK